MLILLDHVHVCVHVSVRPPIWDGPDRIKLLLLVYLSETCIVDMKCDMTM